MRILVLKGQNKSSSLLYSTFRMKLVYLHGPERYKSSTNHWLYQFVNESMRRILLRFTIEFIFFAALLVCINAQECERLIIFDSLFSNGAGEVLVVKRLLVRGTKKFSPRCWLHRPGMSVKPSQEESVVSDFVKLAREHNARLQYSKELHTIKEYY